MRARFRCPDRAQSPKCPSPVTQPHPQLRLEQALPGALRLRGAGSPEAPLQSRGQRHRPQGHRQNHHARREDGETNQGTRRSTRAPTQHHKNSIFRLIRSDNYYQIVPIVYEEKAELIQKPLWLVVRSLPSRVRPAPLRATPSGSAISSSWASRS